MWFVLHNSLASFSILLIVSMRDETVAQKEKKQNLRVTLCNTNDGSRTAYHVHPMPSRMPVDE